MSNAFARKHGLDPKDNPLLNLQRIALQQTTTQPQQHAVSTGASETCFDGFGMAMDGFDLAMVWD
jgi:hypothetical protein